MELSDPSVITALLDGLERRQRQPRARRGMPALDTSSRVKVSTPRRCKCGTCAFCLDNARWDRIFQEKFADPDYYSRPEVKFGSALSEIG
jgi:hypothetical protein